MKDIIEALPCQEMQPDFSNYPDVYALAKKGEYYLMYFSGTKQATIELPGERPYRLDGIDTWEMKTLPIGSAGPGRFSFTPPKNDFAIRLTRYAPGEKIRPQAVAEADKLEGIAPLTVNFSTPWDEECLWDFGDGSSSTGTSPSHIFAEPGVYAVTLTVTDKDGAAACTILAISADRNSDEPIVRFGFAEGDYPKASLHGGEVVKMPGGGYDLGSGEPFKWIKVGDGPVKGLEGARSFTVCGWLKASDMKVGAGGNRILFTLQHNHSGIDIVHHSDGAMRLAVNEWPDNIRNDSSKGKVQMGKWVFFAVTYDASKQGDNVCWYFGDETAAAEPDRTNSYDNGPPGKGSGNLVIGNFNETLQGAGLDRQFRGQMRRLQIYASRLSGRGALPLEKIRELQEIK